MVVHLDHDEEMGTMHGMYGTLDAELEAQRTIKRAEVTAGSCLLRKVIGPTVVHVDNKGIIDGLWKGKMKCIGPRAKDADLWIFIWEKLKKRTSGRHLGGGRARQSAPLQEGSTANVAIRKILSGGGGRSGWAGVGWCDVGWRNGGADQRQHSPARRRGGLSRSVAVCTQLSSSGGGMTRL